MDESQILKKILAVVQKQQIILKKLAQVSQEDPGIRSYLQMAWQTAGLNSGISEMSTPQVTYKPGSSGDNITSESSYIITGPIPLNMRVKFKTTFDKQIQSQKPELDGRINIIYQ